MTVKFCFFSLILDFNGEDENNESKTKRMRLDENVEAQQEGGREQECEDSISATVTTVTPSITLQTASDRNETHCEWLLSADEEKGDLKLHTFNKYICKILDKFHFKTTFKK